MLTKVKRVLLKNKKSSRITHKNTENKMTKVVKPRHENHSP